MVRRMSVSFLVLMVILAWSAVLCAGVISHKVDIDSKDISLDDAGSGAAILKMNGAGRTNYLGYPAIPYKVISVLLPQGEEVSSFRLEGGRRSELAGSEPLAEYTGDILDDGTVRGLSVSESEVVGKDSIFPAWDVKHLGTRIYRGYRIASFAIYPIRYNLETKRLTVDTGFDLVVETEADQRMDGVERLRHIDGFRERTKLEIESLVVNPGESSSYIFNELEVDGGDRDFVPSFLPSMEGSEVVYLIITNEEMKYAYEVLADWKTKKGIPAVVRTVEWISQNYWSGADLAETIRNFIAEAYAKWGVEYVLLAGDTEIIPARLGYVSFYTGDFIPTDMYYSCLDGTWNADGDSLWGEAYHSTSDPGDDVDLYAEVFLGRMPTSTYTEAVTLVNKSISYEMPTETSSKTDFLLLGEVIFPSSYTAGDDIILDGAEILEDIYDPYLTTNPDARAIRLYEAYSLYPGANQLSVGSAIDSMNLGVNHVIHAGHGYKYNMSVGTGSILNYDAASLTNGAGTFSMYLMNCTNVAFDTDCLAEYFLLNANGGAFAVTGSSRSAFPSTSRPYMDNYYYLLFSHDIVQLGKLYTKSREPYTPGANAESADRWTHFIYNYLGDPELCMFRGEVSYFTVDMPASASFGPNDLTITVNSGGVPYDSAYVCLYKDGDDYAYGYTDGSGEIVFEDFLCRIDGQIEVTVTGLDHARYIDTIDVIQETGAFLRVNKTRIYDDIIGNEDDVLDSGETVGLGVKLENTGETNAEKIYAFVRTDNPKVVVTDSIGTYPDITVGGVVYALEGFEFSVDPSMEDEEAIEFTIDIHDSTGGFWTEKFAIEVHAPELELFVNSRSDMVPYGNGNGTIEVGENYLLNIGVKNFGTGVATGLEGKIVSSNGVLTVVDSTSVYADLGLLEIGNGSGFVVNELNLSSNNFFTFTLTDAFGREFTRVMELRSAAAPDSITLDASFGANEIHVTWHAPNDIEDHRYLVYHSMSPGGPYEQASPDLLLHTLFRDHGLQASTIYYYVVVTVDSCGNISDYSEELTTTTSPPQLEGWPNSVSKETSSSPKLGDVNGDTHVDVVIGSEYVHAWRGDGVEIRDGDGQPITWGILNTEGKTFTATVALGNLDSDQALEIVGASWDTKEIFVFDADGSILPGFPKTTVDIVWASPVLGDFDGDGDLEIFVYDIDGTVYAWHHDGTEFADGDSNPATDGPFFAAGSPSDGWHVSTPAMADIDGDDMLELIVAAPSSFIYALNPNGLAVPGWPVAVSAGANISSSPAVGDIDNDGFPEIIVHNSYAQVYGLNHDGTSMSGWPKWVNAGGFFIGSPALGDLTGDGYLEVVVPGQNGYVYIFTHTGSSLPGWPIQYSSGGTESSPIIADITGDGDLDIILAGEDGFLNAWTSNGLGIPGFPIKLNGYIRGTPVVGDLDQDGDVELISACWNQDVYVWDIDEKISYGYTPWNGFHGNILNNGWFEHPDVTAAEGLACAYQLDGTAVLLNWSVITGVEKWDLYRSEDGRGFEMLAAGLQADQSGIVYYSDAVVEEGLSYTYRLEAAGNGDLFVETGSIAIPVEHARLYQNYPNPFNPTTRISFTVPGGSSTSQPVLLVVYDVRGAMVKTLLNSEVASGRHTITWDGSNNRGEPVSSGVYFSRLSIGGFREVKKMLLLR